MVLLSTPWETKPTIVAGVMKSAGCGFDCEVIATIRDSVVDVAHTLNGQTVTFQSSRPEGRSPESMIDAWSKDVYDQTMDRLAPLHETRWE